MALQARNQVFLSLHWGQPPLRLDVAACYSQRLNEEVGK